MTRGFAFTVLFALVSAPSWPQNQDETFSGPHIDKLIGEGRYQEAYDFIAAGVQMSNAQQRVSATYYAGFGKFFLEVGRPMDAAEALKAADRASAQSGESAHFYLREQAAYQLAQGDCAAAASTAAKAYRESSYRRVKDIVLAYCRSLEALARLRSGDLQRAEKLIRETLRDVPKDNDSEPLFASRVLFAGCIIESHRGNYQEGQELCRRGLEVLEKKKIDSRDVSLADLAMAESYFLSGDLARSREFAEKSMEHTAKMFQPKHQDTVAALELLARVDLKEAKPADAVAHAEAAVDMAMAVFGKGAGGTKGPMQTLQAAAKANAK
jgi:ATP/maltotriose-dependent transcriptional regulator MalT